MTIAQLVPPGEQYVIYVKHRYSSPFIAQAVSDAGFFCSQVPFYSSRIFYLSILRCFSQVFDISFSLSAVSILFSTLSCYILFRQIESLRLSFFCYASFSLLSFIPCVYVGRIVSPDALAVFILLLSCIIYFKTLLSHKLQALSLSSIFVYLLASTRINSLVPFLLGICASSGFGFISRTFRNLVSYGIVIAASVLAYQRVTFHSVGAASYSHLTLLLFHSTSRFRTESAVITYEPVYNVSLVDFVHSQDFYGLLLEYLKHLLTSLLSALSWIFIVSVFLYLVPLIIMCIPWKLALARDNALVFSYDEVAFVFAPFSLLFLLQQFFLPLADLRAYSIYLLPMLFIVLERRFHGLRASL